jgi:hypothetical protein
VNKYGKERIFRDVTAIESGSLFQQHIFDAIKSANIVLVIIGQSWLTIRDEHGRRRIDMENDLVKAEVSAALKSKSLVIPVLIDGAIMPSLSSLPDELAELSNIHSVIIRDDPDFDMDFDRLCKTMGKNGFA